MRQFNKVWDVNVFQSSPCQVLDVGLATIEINDPLSINVMIASSARRSQMRSRQIECLHLKLYYGLSLKYMSTPIAHVIYIGIASCDKVVNIN